MQRVRVGARETVAGNLLIRGFMAKDKKSSSTPTIEGEAEEVKKTKKKTSPLEFFQQVRAEGQKVTWTSRNETLISTVMVLIMVAIMSVFFLAVDWVLRGLVSVVLSLG